MISSKLVPIKIGAEIKSSLNSWDYAAQKSDRITSIDTFRELIFSPSRRTCYIDITNDLQIEVTIPATSFHTSLKKDFHYNYLRINKLEKAISHLKPNNTPVAWKVVTYYYKSFFCAIEILRLLGRFSLYLNDDEISKLHNASRTIATGLRSGTYSGTVRLTSTQGFKITLIRHDKSHHSFVWEMFNNTYNSIISSSKDLNQAERRKLQALGGNIDRKIPIPSEIRNKWNYQRADYFGSTGESCARNFIKITSSEERISKWFETSTNSTGEDHNLCNLAYLSVALKKVLDEVNNLIITTETTI